MARTHSLRKKQVVSLDELMPVLQNSKRPTICFDIDGTLSLTTSALFDEVNQKFGTDYVYEDMTDFDVRACLTPEIAAWSKARFSDPDFYPGLKCGESAMHALQELAKSNCNLIIVTDREANCLEVTKTWVDEHGANYDYLVVGGWGTKKKMVHEYTGKAPLVILDDNITMATALSQSKATSLYLMLPKTPWTMDKGPLQNNVLIFQGWQKVLDKIQELGLNTVQTSSESEVSL